MSITWTLNHKENKHNLCRQKDCMKKMCGSLTERENNIIDFGTKICYCLQIIKKSVLYLWKNDFKKAF